MQDELDESHGSLWLRGRLCRNSDVPEVFPFFSSCDALSRQKLSEPLIRWDIRDFRPSSSDNVFIEFCPIENVHLELWSSDVDHDICGASAKHDFGSKKGIKAYLRHLRLDRNTIFASHGYPFEDKALHEHFEDEEWYEPSRTYKPALLTEMDRESHQGRPKVRRETPGQTQSSLRHACPFTKTSQSG